MTDQPWPTRRKSAGVGLLAFGAIAFLIWWRFETDMQKARARIATGSLVDGTYASAQFTAGRIAGAKFIAFDRGGHTWVGHHNEMMSAILNTARRNCSACQAMTPIS